MMIEAMVCFGLMALLGMASAQEGDPPPPPAVTVGPEAAIMPPVALDARSFGALGDGKADDTAAIQNALEAAGAQRGGIVWLPRGNYRVAGHLRVPDDVTLQGVWTAPTAWTQMEGSTLLAEEGRGSEEGAPFIMLCRNGTIKGLTIYYPGQKAEDIQPYPWTVASSGADNPSIIDVLIVNPYKAVDFATRNSGRHYIRNLYGQPLRIGIQVDKCYDVGRIENVHFWPFWNWGMGTPVGEFLRLNGEAFIFGRTDWEYVLNTFVFGYKVGYRFIETRDGGCNGNFVGIGADAASIAVQVDQCQGIGLLITNGEFVSFLQPEPTEVVVNESNSGLVQFTNCAFWGPAEQIARIRGKGSVSFNQCHFMHWNSSGRGLPAVDCDGGELTINATRFATNAPGVRLGPKTRAAVITSNTFVGPAGIWSETEGDVQIGLNASLHRPLKLEPGVVAVDDADGAPSFVTTGKWTAYGDAAHIRDRAVWAQKGDGQATATWSAVLPKAGLYEVWEFHGPDPNRDHAKDAVYTVFHGDGQEAKVTVDQTQGGDGWHRLGTWEFIPGQATAVRVTNAASGNVMADAVKWVPVER